LIAFVSDLRGTYPLGGDNLLFAVKVSDLPTLRFGGGRMFGEVVESHISFSMHSVALGFRYYGTLDSLFNDYVGYLALRLWNLGLSAGYGRYGVGSEAWSYAGLLVSAEGRVEGLSLRLSGGYLETPLMAMEMELRRDDAGVKVVATSRPAIYVDVALYPYLDFGSFVFGGMYRVSGNAFGLFLTYRHPLGLSSILFSSHEALGEGVLCDNLLMF